MKKIPPEDLICLNDLVDRYPIGVDLVYAQPHHPENMFKTEIYRPEAKMWGHKDLVDIVLHAAKICHEQYGWRFIIKDCLRTTDAQQRMSETAVVKANPHWLQEPNRLLSPPGMGGHPRGMAVDIDPIDSQGHAVDMGTPFDYLTTDRQHNPAARSFNGFAPHVLENRQRLEKAMLEGATFFKRPILPLPQEWWDFRFLPDYTRQFAPLSDADLPPAMQMTRPI